ncbi:ribosomal protein L37AE/L43A [Saccharopolyspora lacisalsi]|uniref:Ribosomal protein L37AE/L43A n=1 Tax=Halosaccharopolyspora lacisalsi TaxID=1000566 RepID=A0A839DTK6_9PSEU|nr:hypothetical protein [Halosaccharopolyspora lacisalsi]MBA8825302.1 ribosomal protein L37AE/L43A [Halosaccharopolyspora lacisalsi]
MPRKTTRRKGPPVLHFPKPSCSLCHRETVERAGRFRCRSCGCSWDADTAHLYPGEWDATEQEVA